MTIIFRRTLAGAEADGTSVWWSVITRPHMQTLQCHGIDTIKAVRPLFPDTPCILKDFCSIGYFPAADLLNVCMYVQCISAYMICM